MILRSYLFRVVLFIAAAIPLYFVLGALQNTNHQWHLYNHGKKETAKIISTVRRLVEDDDGDYYKYKYTVAFSTDEEEVYVPLEREERKFISENTTIDIIYDPQNPYNAQRYVEYRLTISPIINLIATILLWLVLSGLAYQGVLWPKIGELIYK